VSSNTKQVCFELDSAHKVHNKVRGFAGWPGVWTPLRVGGEAGEEGEIGEGGESERFKLITTQVASLTHLQQFLSPSSSSSPSSSVHVDLEQLRRGRNVIVERGRMFVLCAPDKKKNDEPSPGPSFSVLEILEIQAAGKKPVGAKAFANGVRGKAVRWVPQEKKRD
jgi:methionyl-tRNA formyltransferase